MADGELKIDHNAAEAAAKPEPGQVITPASATPSIPAAKPEQAQQPEQSAVTQQPPPVDVPTMPSSTSPASLPPAKTTPTEKSPAHDSHQFDASVPGEISWTASEFIAHEKSTNWYLGVAIVGIIIAAAVFLVIRDYISTVVVLVGTLAFGMLGAKRPKQVPYKLNNDGLTIAQKHYAFHAFKSFAVVPEGAFSSIVFMPLKRFATLTTIYYPPEEERQIADLLSQHLPLETHKLDSIDHLMQRIRF